LRLLGERWVEFEKAFPRISLIARIREIGFMWIASVLKGVEVGMWSILRERVGGCWRVWRTSRIFLVGDFIGGWVEGRRHVARMKG
jgi:hypothetical protein